MKDLLVTEMETNFYQGRILQALDCVGQLLDKLDQDDDDDAEVLYEILSTGFGSGHSEEFVNFLVGRAFDCSLTWHGKGGMALQYANFGYVQPEVFHILETLGMDADLTDRAGNSVLHHFAGLTKSPYRKEMEGQMAALVRERADISCWMEPNAYGSTPLHLAVLNHHQELLTAILEKGIDPNLCGSVAWTGFSHVINFAGVTALMLACSIGDVQTVRLLRDAGARDAMGDLHGCCASHYALDAPNQHFCKSYYTSIPGKDRVLAQKLEILEQLESFDIPNDRGISPLLKALKEFRSDEGNFALLLIQRGADGNRADNSGYTPLMAAAEHRNQKALKSLVAAGMQLNAQNNRGETALLLAVQGHDEKAARLLLKKGALADIPDQSGRTAGELAAEYGMDAVLELLI